MKNNFHPSAFFFVPFLAALVVVLSYCTNDPEEVKAVSKNKNLPVEWADDVTILYSDRGVIRGFMHAPRLEKYAGDQEKYTVMPEGIKAVFYDSAMNERSSINAGYAIEYPDRRIVEARYHIKVINETNDTLFTESLTWNRNLRLLSTNSAVRIITHENEVIYGENGMEADERFKRWRIKNVKESSLIIREDSDE